MSGDAQRYSGSACDWDTFVSSQPNATAAHLFGWKRVIERVYGHDCPYLATKSSDRDRLTGVLPLVDVRSLAFGRFLVSMPYLNAGGPLGDANTTGVLAREVFRLAHQRRARAAELRCTSMLPVDQEPASEKVASLLELPASTDALWSAVGGKLRSQVRRPQKEGIEVRFGPDQLEPFFTVFARNMRDLGSPTHPRQFFQAIAEEFGERVWFGCAWYQGIPVAAGCALVWRTEVEMTWASSLREYNAFAPNMLLYWAFMERAISSGLTRFNFGRSTSGSGAHKFKRQWGAVDTALYWYRSSRGNSAGTPRPDGPAMLLATRIWRRVPVPVATLIGSRLRGGIPQ